MNKKRSWLIILSVLYSVFIVVPFLVFPSTADKTATQTVGNIVTVAILLSLINVSVSYHYAKAIGRSAGIWALGALLLPFLVPIVLAFQKESTEVSIEQINKEEPPPQQALSLIAAINTGDDSRFAIDDIVIRNRLRPLGNKKRLGFDGATCNDYRAQFRDRPSAERYYEAFLKYARIHPPPMLIEVMVAYTPNTIYSEKYAFILPYFNVDEREDYRKWAGEAIMTCNDVQRQHSYCAGNNYSYLPGSISSKGTVIRWTIIAPETFDPDSIEALELLTDPPEMGFERVAIEGQENIVPEKPNPAGPWIGVLFDIGMFDEALYGSAATKQLLSVVGIPQLSGCIIHGGDLLPEAKYWCSAIHTSTEEQADIIEMSVTKCGDAKLAQDRSPVIRGHQLPVDALPFQGFVTTDGVYVGT
jgi:hypothetical protein